VLRNRPGRNHFASAVSLIALLVCLIPTTIGGLLSAIGIAGMDRLIRFNVIATSGRSVEAAGDVDTLLLDKTGTITFGNRMATEFLPVRSVTTEDLAAAALASSLADETPEGRSIVALAKGDYRLAEPTPDPAHTNIIPFTAQTRISGVDIAGRSLRKGAIDSILRYLKTTLDLVSPACRASNVSTAITDFCSSALPISQVIHRQPSGI